LSATGKTVFIQERVHALNSAVHCLS